MYLQSTSFTECLQKLGGRNDTTFAKGDDNEIKITKINIKEERCYLTETILGHDTESSENRKTESKNTED